MHMLHCSKPVSVSRCGLHCICFFQPHVTECVAATLTPLCIIVRGCHCHPSTIIIIVQGVLLVTFIECIPGCVAATLACARMHPITSPKRLLPRHRKLIYAFTGKDCTGAVLSSYTMGFNLIARDELGIRCYNVWRYTACSIPPGAWT